MLVANEGRYTRPAGCTSMVAPCWTPATATDTDGATTAPNRCTSDVAAAPTDGQPAFNERLPDPIPAGGVEVNHLFIALPAPAVTPTVSREQAIATAQENTNVPGSTITAQLAVVTVPESLPTPGYSGAYDSVDHELCWIVTFNFPQPVNEGVSGASYANRSYDLIDCAQPGRPLRPAEATSCPQS